MKGLNQVQLIGNLGGDPEMRFTPAGKAVTTFSMATSRKYKGQDGQLVEETTWHKIVCWDSLAESCNKSLSKGDPVFTQGRINNRQWEDDTGQKHYASEIIAGQVIFLGKPKIGRDTLVEATIPDLEVADNGVPEAPAPLL
ncbi:MAG: single-stranded DNA-binding protein [Dehalococcoidales bacterium]|nr:single-stranded DNA-binding protein [Dehalococcoidales bacterium]